MAENETSTPNETLPPPRRESTGRRIFIGPRGLRAGWRFVLYLVLVFAIAAIGGTIARLFGAKAGGALKVKQVTPLQLGIFEGSFFLYNAIAAWIMGKIEGRKFGQYGLPLQQALRKDFWVGLVWGFLTTSGTLLAIFVLHGVQVTGPTIHGGAILSAAGAWAITFLLVGLSEEFSFRGYTQFTLATGMGFWPAAFVLSALFGLAHRGNSGENILGESSVVLFGLLFCLFLRRTGNLWWAVGFHMGYDWGQTFFYGVPDSGLLPYHNLLSASFSGPRWLTGGTVGPEASVFCPIALVIVGILFSLTYREARYRAPG
jgi:uncharacterized protein